VVALQQRPLCRFEVLGSATYLSKLYLHLSSRPVLGEQVPVLKLRADAESEETLWGLAYGSYFVTATEIVEVALAVVEVEASLAPISLLK
jgi:hypothetical protein